MHKSPLPLQVAKACVCLKAMVMLLWIHCLSLLALFVLGLFCYAVLSVHSNRLDGDERAAYFTLVVCFMSCDCLALSHGTVGLSAVCDCCVS